MKLRLFLVAVLLTAFVSCDSSSGDDTPHLAGIQHFLMVPLARQSTDYTCGVAALQSVLGYYGEDIRQDTLAAALGSTEADGTDYHAIERYAKSNGYNTVVQTERTLDDLKALVDRGVPPIILIQAWAEDPANWETDYADGHYVVALGYDDTKIYFMDPSTLGNYTSIPVDEFLQRWHDRERDGTLLNHFLMTIDNGHPRYQWDRIIPLH